jgi:hypothetical protein
MEEVKVEDVEVVCTDCIGNMQLVQVNKNTPKLFTPRYFQTLVLFCQHCQKTGKPFVQKIKKQQ